MTKPPGKLLPLVAALLCGAAVAQADTPPAHPATTPAPTIQAAAAPGHFVMPITHKQGPPTGAQSVQRPRQPVRPPATPTAADDWNLTAHGKVLYLTFDDGPQHEWTPKVLQVLRKHNAHATFFVLGMQVAQYPELVALEKASGHHIGNHTWDHKLLTKLPAAQVRQEIVTGVKSKCFRPPGRETNAAVVAVAAANHQRQVLWDVDTKDWMKPGVAKIEHAILSGARPGAIILLHDGGGNRSETVAAVDQALTKLSQQGYTYQSLPC